MSKKKDLSELDADLFGNLRSVESDGKKFVYREDEFDNPTPLRADQFGGLNNEIPWRKPDDKAYDGSTLPHHDIDPMEGPRYFKPANAMGVDKYCFPDVTPEQAEIIANQLKKQPVHVSDIHNHNRMYPLTTEESFKAKERLYLGIDPGKSGGIVGLDLHGGFIKSIIPVLGDDVDIHELYAFFTPLKEKYNCTLILEDVHSMFKMSAGSNFTFGFVCGAIEAIVIAHGFKLIKIAPKTWQKELWQNSDKQYKPLEKGQKNPSINTKLTSLICAKRLFPKFDFRKSDSIRVKNDHDGIIDACLIAEYGRRKNL